MIVFDLSCQQGHRFEGWFSSAEDFSGQLRNGVLACPVCSSLEVERVPSPTRFNTLQTEARPPQTQTTPRPIAQGELRDPFALAQILYSKMLDDVFSKTEDVGKDFPAEARRIHNDEAAARPIRGVATRDEHDALIEEGIPVVSLPIPPGERMN
ncbi:MAG: DUF1178 family protein [Betaproteobacteria bacterium]|nr:DUF1178 family protein [Betaproteobacteria bacterium]